MSIVSAASDALASYRWLLPALALVTGLGGGFFLGWQVPAAKRQAESARADASDARLQAASAQWAQAAEKLRADSLEALRARDAAVSRAIKDATAILAKQVSEGVAPLKALSGPSWDCLRRPLSEDVLSPLRREPR